MQKSSTFHIILSNVFIVLLAVCLYTSVILTGIFVNGAIPLFYELSCEMCYPVAEGITGGYLTFLNNFVGIVLLFMFYINHIGKYFIHYNERAHFNKQNTKCKINIFSGKNRYIVHRHWIISLHFPVLYPIFISGLYIN